MKHRVTRTAKEGRVNVAIGARKNTLRDLATEHGTTESNFARVLILDGLRRIESGELVFRGPSVEPATQAEEVAQ